MVHNSRLPLGSGKSSTPAIATRTPPICPSRTNRRTDQLPKAAPQLALSEPPTICGLLSIGNIYRGLLRRALGRSAHLSFRCWHRAEPGNELLGAANAERRPADRARVGQQVGQLGTEVTRRNLNVQPTLVVRLGYRFFVRVEKDILFNGPYSAMTAEGETGRSLGRV